jgi:predicted RNA methylase
MMPNVRDRLCVASGNGTGAASAVATKSGKPIRVLLVESDPCAAEVIMHDVSRNGVTVTFAGTLAEARSFLLKRPCPVDVVCSCR